MPASAAAVCVVWRRFRLSTVPRCFLCAVSRRWSGTAEAPRPTQEPKRSKFRPSPSPTHDWVGPPNPLSNLRPVVCRVPEDETQLEKRLRELRQETENWNHHFWTEQNFTFSKEKEAFIISSLKAKGLTVRDEQGRRRALDSDEMAVFYKDFLDTNRKRHANYNKEWYRRNVTITLLMVQVLLHNLWRKVINHKPRGPMT